MHPTACFRTQNEGLTFLPGWPEGSPFSTVNYIKGVSTFNKKLNYDGLN